MAHYAFQATSPIEIVERMDQIVMNIRQPFVLTPNRNNIGFKFRKITRHKMSKECIAAEFYLFLKQSWNINFVLKCIPDATFNFISFFIQWL
jgi:hypothetical protein